MTESVEKIFLNTRNIHKEVEKPLHKQYEVVEADIKSLENEYEQVIEKKIERLIEKIADKKKHKSDHVHKSTDKIVEKKEVINIPNNEEGKKYVDHVNTFLNDTQNWSENLLMKKDINDEIFTLMDECNMMSTTGDITFRFYFVEGRSLLKVFHFKMFVILKKFIEKLVNGHSHIDNGKYVVDVFVFVTPMKSQELGSAMIYKFVKNDELKIILPTKTVMKVNSKYLSNSKNERINIKLVETLFHEMVHCLGFGYWDLFNKSITHSQFSKGEISGYNLNVNQKALAVYRNILHTPTIIGIPMTEDRVHYSTFNSPMIKNDKLFGVFPGLKYEIMSSNYTDVNLFTRITAAMLEEMGYKININMCDEYPLVLLPTDLSVEYTLTPSNHFAFGIEKYSMLLKSGDTVISGTETFVMRKNQEYKIRNTHSYMVFVTSGLEESEEYLLKSEDGVHYQENEIVITPNSNTPSLFYIISSITFGGIPIIKVPENWNINNTNCYSKYSLHKIMELFVKGKPH